MRVQFGPKGEPSYFPTRAMTGAERIAEWRKNHPDRVEAYNAKRREDRRLGKLRAKETLRLIAEAVKAKQVPALPAKPVQLCLPPATTEPLFVFTIDERATVEVESL